MQPEKTSINFEKRRWFIINAIIFKAILELSYVLYVNPLFSYAGFILDLNIFKYIESWAIYITLAVILPNTLHKPSDFLMSYLFFSFLSPLLVFYELANASRTHLYIVLWGVSLIYFFRNGRPLKILTIKHANKIGLLILISGSLFVTLWMIYSGGLRYFNLDLSKVYSFRQDVSDTIDVGIMVYINIWATKVFGPMLLTLALWKKKYQYATLIFLLHIIWFGISSHKAVLFYPFLVLMVYFWFKKTRALFLIATSMSIVVITSLTIFLIYEDITLGSLFIRRVFFIPSFLTFVYYDFFSQNDFIYWSNSLFSSWITYPYSLDPAKLIGHSLDTEAHANNSFLSTGFMHAGIVGVSIYGILVGLLFRLIDSISKHGIPTWAAVSCMIVPSFSLLASADLPTSLLTHGVGIAIFLLFLLRSKNYKG